MEIRTSDWLTRGIPQKKLDKEKKKALKEHDRYMRKLKKEQCKKHKNCYGCQYLEPTLFMNGKTTTYDYVCQLDKRV